MPATPGSRLLKMLKQTENQNQIDNQSRIKFIETSGRRYIDHLKIRDPYQENCSSEERCLMCMNSDKQTNCKISNVGYSIMCKTCKEKKVTRSYEGETCRNGYLRGKEHLKALENKTESSVLYRHIQNEHKGEPDDVKFEMKTTGRFKSAMNRQIDEGVRIQNKKAEFLLNSKSEFYGPAVKRTVLEG